MFEIETFYQYISIQIEILFELKIQKSNLKIDRKLKKFFIYCVYLNAKGIDITSYDAAIMLKEYMGWKFSDNVYTYRNHLKTKGWLSEDLQTNAGYNVIPIFRNIDLDNLVFNYSFTIKCTQKNLQKKL